MFRAWVVLFFYFYFSVGTFFSFSNFYFFSSSRDLYLIINVNFYLNFFVLWTFSLFFFFFDYYYILLIILYFFGSIDAHNHMSWIYIVYFVLIFFILQQFLPRLCSFNCSTRKFRALWVVLFLYSSFATENNLIFISHIYSHTNIVSLWPREP